MDQGRFTSALVKGRTLPRPGTSPSRRPRVCTLGGPRNGVRGARRRSLGDALDGATRTRDQVTPGALGLLACDCGSAPNRHSSRAAFVRPSRQEESATRCHDGVAPVHASCETTTRVGARACSRMRAARVSCTTSRDVGPPCPLTCDEGSRRREHAPVGSERVEGRRA